MFAYAERLNPSPRYYIYRDPLTYYGPRGSPYVMFTMPPLRDCKIPVRWVDRDELVSAADELTIRFANGSSIVVTNPSELERLR